MSESITITLSERIAAAARRLAEASGQSIEAVIVGWVAEAAAVEEYVAELRLGQYPKDESDGDSALEMLDALFNGEDTPDGG